MTAAASIVRHRDRKLLERVLTPYHAHCRYLLDAFVEPGGPAGELVSVEGQLSIPSSCYIASTGHFNAVEFNICYNQLAYFMLASCAAHGLLDAMAGWSVDEFARRQLSDFLILQFSSSFRAPMNADRFTGRVAVTRVMKRGASVFIKTTCEFEDGRGGHSHGGALIAITGDAKPAAARPAAVLYNRLKATPARARAELLTRYVRDELAARLGVEASEIGPRDRLMDLGVDSLKAVEMKTSLEVALGTPLSTSLVFDKPTIESLVPFLLEAAGLEAAAEPSPAPAAPGPRAGVSGSDGQEDVERLAELLEAELSSLAGPSRGPR